MTNWRGKQVSGEYVGDTGFKKKIKATNKGILTIRTSALRILTDNVNKKTAWRIKYSNGILKAIVTG